MLSAKTGMSGLWLTIVREGLVGDYDYAFLFKPHLPFMQKSRRPAPFFGLNDDMPVVLALLLGFQHALSILAGNHSSNYPRRSGRCQLVWGASTVPCFNLLDRPRFSFLHSNYQVSLVQDSILPWNWFNLSRGHQLQYHSCGYRGTVSDVRHRPLPYRCRRL